METNTTKNTKQLNRKITLLSIGCLIISLFLLFFIPEPAAAEMLNFNKAIQMIKQITTNLLLPIAIVACGWKIIYIAIFGGLIGNDPLNMIKDMNGNKDGISMQEVKVSILGHLAGFFKGLMWVGGIWIILQVAILLASFLATTFTKAF